MSKPDKHTPLSAEELFKLLEENSNKASDFDALDDFEKEALEGFSAHSTPENAKVLTEELNAAILKKASEQKGGSKHKVIWFSAAASIVLIIMISVFFFNQSKQDSQTNIALNEIKQAEEQMTELNAVSPQETATGNTSLQEDATLPGKGKSKALSGKDSEVDSREGLAMGPMNAVSENKPSLGGVSGETTILKDEAKARTENDYDAAQKQPVLADKVDAKKKEKSNLEQEQRANSEVLLSQNVSTAVTTTKDAKEEEAYKYKANANKNQESKNTASKSASNEKSKLAKESAAQYKMADDQANGDMVSYSTSNTTQAPSPISVNNSLAYYEGGELAIRDFVLSYLKEKQITTPIIGKYKVTGVVDTAGKLKVSTIIQLTKEYCGCSDQIKEALNTCTKWTPATNGVRKSASDVEFVIAF